MAGNANSGRKRNQHVANALIVEMNERNKDGDKRGIRRLAVNLWDLVEAGDMAASIYVRDTIDGKPAQQLTLTGDEDNPLSVVTRIKLVGPDGK